MMPECNNLFMRLALGMFGAGFAVVVISGLGLAWDGAYQLVYVLENSVVRVGYGRFTQGAIFAAVLALSRFTDNVNALTWTFGGLHAALPLTALLGAWVILRIAQHGGLYGSLWELDWSHFRRRRVWYVNRLPSCRSIGFSLPQFSSACRTPV